LSAEAVHVFVNVGNLEIHTAKEHIFKVSETHSQPAEKTFRIIAEEHSLRAEEHSLRAEEHSLRAEDQSRKDEETLLHS
jgi:hypothetical protein